MLLDIGHGRGAIVLRAPVERSGLEVEIHPVGRPDERTHVGVLPRAAGGRTTHAAVFASLEAGRYVVLGPDGEHDGEVEVTSGEVAFAFWG